MDPKHIPALDGVRGIAILAVIAFHARVAFSTTGEIPNGLFQLMALGWSGVDLFFVLSGFLITGILLDTRDSPSYFRTFYLRRVLRIFPLYFAYLFLILIAARAGWRWVSGADLWVGTNPWWYLSYLLNWKSDHGYNDLFLGHLWSLAVEEQFYLVWPAVVWFVPRRGLKWLCPSVALAALGFRWYLGSHGVDSESVYRMTPCRIDALAIGAWVALGLRDFRQAMERWMRLAVPAAALLFIAAFAASPHPVWSDAPMRTTGASALAVLYSEAVRRAATAEGGAWHRLCSSRTLRLCGKHSYAMYVLHSAPFHLTAEWVRHLSGKSPAWLVLAAKYGYFPALAGVALALSLVSWRFLEEPFLRLKRRVPYWSTPEVRVPAGARASLKMLYSWGTRQLITATPIGGKNTKVANAPGIACPPETQD